MSRKKTKKLNKRVLLISIAAIGLISFLVVNMFLVWRQILLKKQEKNFYMQELTKLQEEEEYLKTEANKLQDPDYVARYAREQYLYSKDGEFNIRIN